MVAPVTLHSQLRMHDMLTVLLLLLQLIVRDLSGRIACICSLARALPGPDQKWLQHWLMPQWGSGPAGEPHQVHSVGRAGGVGWG